MMKKRLLFYGSAVFLSAILGLSACAGSSKSVQTTAAMPAADYEAMDSAETAGERAMEEQAGLELDASKTGMTDTTSLGQALPSNRKLIRSVDLSLETDAFDQLLKTLTDKIGELGGYVEQSDISGNSLNYRNELIPRYASLKVRIPIDRLDGFISVVEANGNITNKSETTQDVTVQYSDLESRKKSLTVEQERICLRRRIRWNQSLPWKNGFPKSATSWSPWNHSSGCTTTRWTTVRSICTSMRLRRKRPLRPLSRKESGRGLGKGSQKT